MVQINSPGMNMRGLRVSRKLRLRNTLRNTKRIEVRGLGVKKGATCSRAKVNHALQPIGAP